MPDLPKKKVGIVACSGEELPEGTVTRLAALRVLEGLRPGDTVTICLPLFLAGGEGDRAFARFYPTIAVDGCDRRCAARATEQYSGKPAASIVVTELLSGQPPDGLGTARRLTPAGRQAAATTAEAVARRVDELLGTPGRRGQAAWDRRAGAFSESEAAPEAEAQEPVEATCACGSGIPVRKVTIDGRTVTVVALPVLMQQFRDAGKAPGEATARELLDAAKLYNPVPAEDVPAYTAALAREYAAFCAAPAEEPAR